MRINRSFKKNNKSKRNYKRKRSYKSKKSKKSKRSRIRKKIGGSNNLNTTEPFFYLNMDTCRFSEYLKTSGTKILLNVRINEDIANLHEALREFNELIQTYDTAHPNNHNLNPTMAGGANTWQKVQPKILAFSSFKEILAKIQESKKEKKEKIRIFEANMQSNKCIPIIDAASQSNEGNEGIQQANQKLLDSINTLNNLNESTEINEINESTEINENQEIYDEIKTKFHNLNIIKSILETIRDSINTQEVDILIGGSYSKRADYNLAKTWGQTFFSWGKSGKKSLNQLKKNNKTQTKMEDLTVIAHGIGNLVFGLLGSSINFVFLPLINLTFSNPKKTEPIETKTRDYGFERALPQLITGVKNLIKKLLPKHI